MDIHRARFVPYPPSAINALAFSHATPDDETKDPSTLRLAVGRANGNIEIWNPTSGSWLQERVFYGGKDRSVEGLVWTQDRDEKDGNGEVIPGRLRLFSIGYSSSITEWDLSTGLPARHSDGSHSEVWCFAAQPKINGAARKELRAGEDDRQDLVAGCADGTLVLLSTADNDLRFQRFLSRSSKKKARVLSVAYKDRNTVLAGFADSAVRVFDTRNGNVLRNISFGSGPLGGPKEILVWKVKCLPNGDFVSGDSTGEIRIFSGKNYSQLQRIAGHEADVLDLAVSQDGSMILSGGMDRRTCFYSCAAKKKSQRAENWRKVSHKRYHDHDVKAMATYEGNNISVVVSGGIDTQPVVLPLRQFGKELSRALPSLPRTPALVSAPASRLMVSWWNSEIRIWRVKSQSETSERPKVVARLALQGDENITSVSITENGSLLAVATSSEVKIFQLTPISPGAGPSLRIKKLEVPFTIGGRRVQFTADGKWLAIITISNDVRVARIVDATEEECPRVLDQLLHLARLPRSDLQQNALNGTWGSYDRTITQVEFSSDGNILAVADLAGYIDTWVIEGFEDSTAPEVDIDRASKSSAGDDESDEDDEVETEQVTMFGQRWIRNPSGHAIPRLDAMPLLLSFQPAQEGNGPEPNGNPAVHPTRHNPHPHSRVIPSTEQHLLVVSAKHQLYDFEVLAGRLSDWSRRNPLSSYPSQFRSTTDDPAKGCLWDVTDENRRIWIYGEKWLFMFDLSRDFPFDKQQQQQQLESDEASTSTKKRKREGGADEPFRKKNSSGAGDAVPEREASISKVRRFINGGQADQGGDNWTDVLHTRSTTAAARSDDEAAEDAQDDLVTLRRQQQNQTDEATSQELVLVDDSGNNKSRAASEPWWHTFKYRPMLGIVPMSSGASSTRANPLEVVIVERPSWDLDLPPRFTGALE
ncbi:small nucleolar ribonucleo protein-like protein complex subunit [Aaosphaeria arxii CBS 175.79]|uniref:Small nucleolar ribonucleo protein-like protein complex subunit n=1 Tax=Aaosphaeria arxii CBS 175.79 TaxID=1450172 RepID=A0A6A5YBI5_9PLEO|nr:small nucleolar ribonucleo protein-like protein complex subunit [Aaosphaeria arxii CBS 175.79]KAF2022071.1 small nucleolar ribonucleo protein-like protein complex subunit [Aaosphaeria arxii CBS 175.79]